MTDVSMPGDNEYVAEFRISADFTVGARDLAEARTLLADTLRAEDSDGTAFVTRTRRVIDEYRSWGVLGWDPAPARPSQAAQVQGAFPSLVNDAATIETLRAVLTAGDRPVRIADLVPEATLQRVQETVADLNPEILVDDPDRRLQLIYQGPADEAASFLSEGAYRAFGVDDREYALIVAPSEITPHGRVSQVIPRDRHDGRTLDEISTLLRQHDPRESVTGLVRNISRRLETTRRIGIPSWVPLDGDLRPEPAPAMVQVGVILWSDFEDVEPSILVDTNPVRLARDVALMIHDGIQHDPAYAGAADFLEAHPFPPRPYDPIAVQGWLDALRNSTDYPAFTLDSRPVSSSPGTLAHDPNLAPVTAEPEPPAVAEEEPLETYQVAVTFDVSARTPREARDTVDAALIGDAVPGTPAEVQRRQQLRADGDVSGVLGWHHPEPAAASVPDPVDEVLQERARQIDPAPAPAPAGEARGQAKHRGLA